jgi:hypothetical protein
MKFMEGRMSAFSELLQRLPRWFWPAAAALGGLVLGLLIGWVWWPVQWTNATLAELSPAAKATYLSAVADAYMADGDPTNARAVLNERLAPLGSDVGDVLLGAIGWYQAQPTPDVVRINNLAMVAGELGAPVDAATLAAGVPPPVGPDLAPGTAADRTATEALPAESVAATDAGESTGAGGAWWRWLLGLIGTAALIGGGFYLFRRATADMEPSDRFTPVPVPASQPATPPPSARTPSSPAPAGQPTPTSAWSTTVVKPSAGPAVGPGDNLAFDNEDLDDDFGDEDDDEAFADDLPAGVNDARLAFGPSDRVETAEELGSATISPRYTTAQGAVNEAAVQPPAKAPSPWSRAGAAPAPQTGPASQAPVSTGVSAATSVKYDAPPTVNAPVPAKPSALSRLATAVSPRMMVARQTTVPTGAAAAAAVAAAPAPARSSVAPATAPASKAAPVPTSTTGRTLLASRTCHYIAGTNGYIEAHTISDPRSNLYIGEFGMGVSLRNAALHSNPSQVIALEVWLTDNQNPADFSNQARVLLSDYAAGKDYAQALLKDRDGSVRTMMTRPGARFTLEGMHLILEGEIQEAQHDEQGVFRSVRVNTSVYRK